MLEKTRELLQLRLHNSPQKSIWVFFHKFMIRFVTGRLLCAETLIIVLPQYWYQFKIFFFFSANIFDLHTHSESQRKKKILHKKTKEGCLIETFVNDNRLSTWLSRSARLILHGWILTSAGSSCYTMVRKKSSISHFQFINFQRQCMVNKGL